MARLGPEEWRAAYTARPRPQESSNLRWVTCLRCLRAVEEIVAEQMAKAKEIASEAP